MLEKGVMWQTTNGATRECATRARGRLLAETPPAPYANYAEAMCDTEMILRLPPSAPGNSKQHRIASSPPNLADR